MQDSREDVGEVGTSARFGANDSNGSPRRLGKVPCRAPGGTYAVECWRDGGGEYWTVRREGEAVGPDGGRFPTFGEAKRFVDGPGVEAVESEPAPVGPEPDLTPTEFTAAIYDSAGNAVYGPETVTAPRSWSQLAVNVVASKYFYREKSGPSGTPRERSAFDMVRRVAGTVGHWAAADGYADSLDSARFSDRLFRLCIGQTAAFNSPVWFNLGLAEAYGAVGSADNFIWHKASGAVVTCLDTFRHPQLSACFLQSVTDDMAGIMRLAASEAVLFKSGSGTGTNLSPLRSRLEGVRGGGRASGPVSFLRIYDAVAGSIKSGGRCLAADQQVMTETGPRTASGLADDGSEFIVLSYSRRLGRVAAKRARAWRNGYKVVVDVVTDKGRFAVSSDHPFMGRDGRPYRADQLKAGMSLLPVACDLSGDGYVRVGLRDGMKGKGKFHQLVGKDVLGWDLEGRVVHHENEVKTDNRPDNLRLKTQAEHAGDHGRGKPFYVDGLPGERNGMHSGSNFWKDMEKSTAYRRLKSAEIVSHDPAAMQPKAVRRKMLNLAYRLINSGYDISTFDGYVAARRASGNRSYSTPSFRAGFLASIERVFGTYEAFYETVRADNHKVVSVTVRGFERVYSIEVIDAEPDDKRPWSEHNYAIVPLGTDGPASGGVFVFNTRRAAKLNCLNCDHPDVMEFIRCKAAEDRKARALIAAGYSPWMTGADDEAYSSVAFQNANLSVRVTDGFMRSAEKNRSNPDATPETASLRAVVTGEVVGHVNPLAVVRESAGCAWVCGDPALQYDDAVNLWHTCPNSGRINTSNPCGEFTFLDETACNLASLNLMKFWRRGGGRSWRFDVDSFLDAVDDVITAQDVMVDRASYPTPQIAANSHRFRPLGLGYSNLGALLMSCGLAYDSEAGRALAGAVTALMHARAYARSAELARDVAPFEGYAANREPMAGVLGMHLERCTTDHAVYHSRPDVVSADILCLWNVALSEMGRACSYGRAYGFRNSQVTLLAPAGTISFMMDCDTTGVEPVLGLVTYKALAGGGNLKLTVGCLREGLRSLGYDDRKAAGIVAHAERYGTVGAVVLEDGNRVGSGLDPKHADVFLTALPPPDVVTVGGVKHRPADRRSLPWRAHVAMCAAVQPYLSGAISKTINMPPDATVDDITDVYFEAWRSGLKSVTVYRDGSKGVQPVTTSPVGPGSVDEVGPSEPPEAAPPTLLPLAVEPVRRRLPADRQAVIHHFEFGGYDGYFMVGFYDDGKPGEVWIRFSKEGSTLAGFADVVGVAVSIGLQYGIPLDVFVRKFSYYRFEPHGFVKDPSPDGVKLASSIVDYVFRTLGRKYCRSEWSGGSDPVVHVLGPSDPDPVRAASAEVVLPAPGNACPTCGALMTRFGPCERCPNCGETSGCG